MEILSNTEKDITMVKYQFLSTKKYITQLHHFWNYNFESQTLLPFGKRRPLFQIDKAFKIVPIFIII